jgi:hypothetical protein
MTGGRHGRIFGILFALMMQYIFGNKNIRHYENNTLNLLHIHNSYMLVCSLCLTPL